MIYLNNAATSWPKPESVYAAVDASFRHLNSPSRSTSLEGKQSTEQFEAARGYVAQFFGIRNPQRLAFVPSCTYGLNAAILGLPWRAGDVALMSGLEHHAVSRPLRKAAREIGIRFEVIPFSNRLPIDLDWIDRRLATGEVKMVACTMASNVTGHVLPIRELGAICRRHDARLLVDAAQSAGVLPVDVDELNIDMMVAAGHKSLFGPPGIGVMFVRDGIVLRPLTEGGTSVDSAQHEMEDSFPSSFEVGTNNLMAVVGLTAGIRWLEETGLAAVHEHELELTDRFLNGLRDLPGLKVYGPDADQPHLGVVSITVDGIKPAAVSESLSERRNIATRSGFHCAPLAHETIGTLRNGGTSRFSFGYFNTSAEVDAAIEVLTELATTPATSSCA